MGARTGAYGRVDGLPVQELHLTLTGTDNSPRRQFKTGDTVLVVAVGKVGKLTHVPKSDGTKGDFFRENRAVVLGDYEIFEPDQDVTVLGPGDEELTVRWDDLVAAVRMATAARQEATEAEKPARTSVSEDIGPEGTQGNI
jgi:hypothetical protein